MTKSDVQNSERAKVFLTRMLSSKCIMASKHLIGSSVMVMHLWD